MNDSREEEVTAWDWFLLGWMVTMLGIAVIAVFFNEKIKCFALVVIGGSLVIWVLIFFLPARTWHCVEDTLDFVAGFWEASRR